MNAPDKCWERIGSFGDKSCDNLREAGHCRNCLQFSVAGRGLFDRTVPDGVLGEWTDLLALEKEIKARGLTSVIIFRLGRELLAVKTAVFQEASEPLAVRSIPGRSGGGLRGLVNVGGELLLCVSGHHVLGMEDEAGREAGSEGGGPQMLVLGRGKDRWVIEADEVLGVTRVSGDEVSKAPATVGKSPGAVASGVFEREGKKIGLLDEDILFAAIARSVAR